MKVLTDIVEKAGGHVWNGEGENPYEGLIACADNLIVTIDSVSMISEQSQGVRRLQFTHCRAVHVGLAIL